MNADIISIGNELLLGVTQNTNASWLSNQLWQCGISTRRVITIRDEWDAIQHTLSDSMKNVQLVIMTGGLGPTHDDITKETVADFFSTPLVENPELKKRIISRFANRGVPMPEINLEQATVPQGAKIIPNKIGTAASFYFEQNDKLCIVMPGVPAEMKQMVKDAVLPLVKQKYQHQIDSITTQLIRTTGIYESKLYEVIYPILEDHKDKTVAFLPHRYGVDLRIEFRSKDKNKTDQPINQLQDKIMAKIRPYVYEIGERSMEEVVAEWLIHEKLTVSVAESCTGGLIQHFLTNIPGSSNFLLGGVIAYNNSLKKDLLDVKETTLQNHGAVSYETAHEMVEGIRNRTGSDCAISITGIAGPGGGSEEKPIGLVFIGCIMKQVTRIEKLVFHKERMLNKYRFSYAALNVLRQCLVDKKNG